MLKGVLLGTILTPVALQNDNQEFSQYTDDKTFVFLSFLYSLVVKSNFWKDFHKSDFWHSPRTILQSHYRLNKIIDRDEDPYISLLRRGSIAALISESRKTTQTRPSRTIRRLVFVPQLWGIIDVLGELMEGKVGGLGLPKEIRSYQAGQSMKITFKVRLSR